MEHLRHRIIMHVEADWPQSLWQWDRLEAEIRAMRESWHEEHESPSSGKYIDDHLPEPASAIRLARECDIPSILPASFYHLSRLSIHDYRCTPQSRTGALDASNKDISNGNRTAEWSILSPDDYICLLKGRAKLISIAQDLFNIGQICNRQHSTATCSLARELTLLADIRDICRQSPDLLETLRRYSEQETFGDRICSRCSIYIRRELKIFRHTVWVQIPEYFSLS